uniref:Uncharacterized protein n=1 Tax=Timema tahoe TaxID=61484 RepID=A0A7R9IJP1_9NEOP|nr:unnamed protein product [Timema tahoe]
MVSAPCYESMGAGFYSRLVPWVFSPKGLVKVVVAAAQPVYLYIPPLPLAFHMPDCTGWLCACVISVTAHMKSRHGYKPAVLRGLTTCLRGYIPTQRLSKARVEIMLSLVPFLLMSLPTISLAQINCNLTDTATQDSTPTGFTINWAALPEGCGDAWVGLCVKGEAEGTFVDRCQVIKDGTTRYSATGLTECSSYRYVVEVANTAQVMQTIEGQASTRPNGKA